MKLNITKKSAILFAVGAVLTCTILFVACNKENAEKSNINDLSSPMKSEMTQPNNPVNPLDNIGINHNIHLNDVLSIINTRYIEPNSLSSDDVLGIYREYLINNGYAENDIDFAFEIIKEGCSIPGKVEQYMESLQDSISIIPNESYDNYKNLVMRYENRIMADATLNDVEEGALLAFTSVYRHSLYYWYEAPSKALPNWVKIAAADAAGAAEGFVGGVTVHWALGVVCGVVMGVDKSIEKAEKLKDSEKPTTDSTSTGVN